MNEKLSDFWSFFLSRFRVSLLITILGLTAGWLSYQNIPRENEPDVEVPAGVIQTIYPGASPQDVEKLVTAKIEREVKKIENLNKYTSTSVSGVSMIAVEFESGTDLTKNFQNLREALDDAQKNLPDGILDDPDLNEIKLSDTPIVSFALSGDFSLSQLKRYAESLQNTFENVSNVKEARIAGIPEEKFHIFIDPQKLELFGLSVEEIAQKIQSHHRDIPLGKIFVQGQKIEVRVKSEFENVGDFLNFPILVKDHQVIHLKDIATIRREFGEMNVESFFSTGKTAKRSVTIDVIKTTQKNNIFLIIQDVFDAIEEEKELGILPPNLDISVVFDGAENIENSLNNLLVSGGQTVFLIIVILFIALGFRESLIALLVLPLSMFLAIAILYSTGKTFNFLSLFALVISLGLLVDNAIIMTEAVSDNINDQKMSPLQAAKKAIADFRWPVITGTFTTIFAFLPMMFVISGVSGDYISAIPSTITIVLLCSLFVSIFLLPVFATQFFVKFPVKKEYKPVLPKTKIRYEKFMRSILTKKRNFIIPVLAAILIFIFSVSLFPMGGLTVEVFPKSDQNYFTLSLEMPAGSDLNETRTLIPKVEEALLPYFEPRENGDIWFKNLVFTLGQLSSFDRQQQRSGGVALSQSEILGITINLVDKKERSTASYEISSEVKKSLEKTIPSFVELTISEISNGPPTGASPVEIRLVGDDMVHMEKIITKLKRKLSGIELQNEAKLKNITDNRGERLPQFTYHFDRDKLEVFGLAPAQIGQTLRSAIEGSTILRISENEDEIDVDLRLDFGGIKKWMDPKSLEILKQLPIKTPSGKFIRLDDIANFEISSNFSTIQHRDGKRTITLGANIEGNATAAQFTSEIEKAIDSIEKLPEEKFSLGGDNEETNRLVKEMALAMGLGLFLILILLVLQFDSFIQSFVIALLVPFSLTGVFLGFWISQTPVSFPTMIGIVALAGIIVNDAIVLLDRINHNLNKGLEKTEAFIEAGNSRMQPILITSITTIIGLLPLALSDPIWEGLGFAIIYGMTLSTILTLILVPCLILVLEGLWRVFIRTITFQWLK